MLELKDKFGAAGLASAGGQKSASHDILNALMALGYNDREALLAAKQLPADVGVADGIKQALKLLSK